MKSSFYLRIKWFVSFSSSLISCCLFADSPLVRIKDLVEIRGVRSNPLIGIGLVVGLPGTGDSGASIATNTAAADLITRLGIQVTSQQVISKNIAIVAVTSELLPFAKVGDKLDLRLSSLGDAASLEGGTLILTPLTAANNQIYAVAQGTITQGTIIGGGNQGGGGGGQGGQAPKSIALSQAATVEREFKATFIQDESIELSLKTADFTTADRVARAINEHYHEYIATPVNSGFIKVQFPRGVMSGHHTKHPVSFVASLEQITVPTDTKAIIVINQRTGTIIAGNHVVLSAVAISHKNLQIRIGKETMNVAEIKDTATVGDLVKALNALGATPADLASILLSLHAANALKAELKLI